MGTKADRDSGISGFVGDLLAKDGLNLYEKWYGHLQGLAPGQKIPDAAVRDEMLGEITDLVCRDNSLILGKKDKLMVEELLNRFLKAAHLLG